ncbi:MAG: hypothetical protein ACE5FD_15785 [Anaerolineae bacterium]
MDEITINSLKELGFKEANLGSFRGRIDDVEVLVAPHPLKGAVAIISHTGPRSATQFEVTLGKNADLQTVATILKHAYEQIHPEVVEKQRSLFPEDS